MFGADPLTKLDRPLPASIHDINFAGDRHILHDTYYTTGTESKHRGRLSCLISNPNDDESIFESIALKTETLNAAGKYKVHLEIMGRPTNQHLVTLYQMLYPNLNETGFNIHGVDVR